AAGVTNDVVLQRLGTAHHRPCAAQPLRIVRVTTDKRHKDGTLVELVLVTNRLDLDVDLIALAYCYRWTVEFFFVGLRVSWAVAIYSVTVRMGSNCRFT